MKVIDQFLLHFNGNQSKAAKALNVTQQRVWWWVNKSEDMPLEFVPKAAQILGVSIFSLRPDIFDMRDPSIKAERYVENKRL